MAKNTKNFYVCLGIDPGTRKTGYAVVKIQGSFIEALDYGVIRPPLKFSLAKRYLVISDSVEKLIENFSPDGVAVEAQFVKKNAQSSLKLGMAKGAVMIAAARKDIDVFEYAPKNAKRAVVGNGSASKQQVQTMVQWLLKLKEKPCADAADALALALCHVHRSNQLNF